MSSMFCDDVRSMLLLRRSKTISGGKGALPVNLA